MFKCIFIPRRKTSAMNRVAQNLSQNDIHSNNNKMNTYSTPRRAGTQSTSLLLDFFLSGRKSVHPGSSVQRATQLLNNPFTCIAIVVTVISIT